MKLADQKFASCYSKTALREFIDKYAGSLSRKVLVQLLMLYYTMTDSKTAKSVVVVILAALGYAVSPIDAIPDPIPFVGLSDDGAIIAATIAYAASSITSEIEDKAENKANEIL